MHKIKEIDMLNPSFYSNPNIVVDLYDYDIGKMFDRLSDPEIINIANMLDDKKLSRVIPKSKKKLHILEILPERRRSLLNEMDIFFLKKIVKLDNNNYNFLSTEKREMLDDVIDYGNYYMSFYITDKFNKCYIDETKEEILSHMVYRTNYLFITDRDNKYLGMAKISDYIKDFDLNRAMKKSYPVFSKKDRVSEFFIINEKYHLEGYPILDKHGKLYGVIDYRGIEDLVNEELIDDYYKLAGFTDIERYNVKDNISLQKRLPWQFISLILSFLLSIMLTGFFERTNYPVLFIWIVPVLYIAGVCASNSLGATVRILEHKRLKFKERNKLVRHEFEKGLVIGIVSAIIVFVVFYFYQQITHRAIIETQFFTTDALLISLIMALIYLVTIFEATSIGVLVPVIISRLKYDFSIASMPFISTITDIVSSFIFFGFSYIVFHFI